MTLIGISHDPPHIHHRTEQGAAIMYALRLKTREHGWGKAEAFPDYDAAVSAIPRNPYPLQYMIARYHPVTPFEPGVVPRCITLIVDSGNWEGVTKPEDFWNPEADQETRRAA